jgi:hypothetical protein
VHAAQAAIVLLILLALISLSMGLLCEDHDTKAGAMAISLACLAGVLIMVATI